MRREEWARKLVHVPGGLLPPLLVVLFGWTGAGAIAIFILAYVLLGWDLWRGGVRLPIVAAALRWTRRAREVAPVGAVEFLASIVVLGLLFPLPYLFGALALLGVGDGAAAIVGLRWGRHALPWNRGKSWEGFAAGVALGLPAFVAFAIVGAHMQEAGYATASRLDGPFPTWPALVFVCLAFLVGQGIARLVVAAGWAPRHANATRATLVFAFAVSFAPALAWSLAAPLWLGGPLLPAQGGHGPGTQAALAAIPVAVMFVESMLRRHDNLVVPGLAAALAYVAVFVGNR